ncbi:GGDEF domain-containing protein [Clostridium nigeriense]|uniref:GGDEF domain-containing protein n=1 Tax=Clostridium nigeriense TaxID=1805470 RepID=UPI003D332AE3
MTNRKEKKIEINYLSIKDKVIEISNRRYFIKEVNKIIENISYKVAFIFINLDSFKYVNNTYLQDSDDKLLCEFSRIIINMNIEDSFFS